MYLSNAAAMVDFVWIVNCAAAIITFIVFVSFIALTAYVYYVHSMYDHLPGPKRTSFFLGNIPEVVENRKKGKLSSDLQLEWVKRHGPVLVVFLYWIPFVTVHSPDGVKEVIISDNHQKSWLAYRNLTKMYGVPFMGNGLITVLDRDLHARKRSLFNPSFHRSYLKNCLGQFNASADQMVEWLQARADGETKVHMLDILNTTALDIIAKIAFGIDLHTFDGSKNPFLKAMKIATEAHEQLALSSPATMLRRMFSPFKAEREHRKEVREACHLLRETGRRSIKNHLEAISNGKIPPSNLVSNMLQNNQENGGEQVMTIEEMMDEFVTFFFAGQETTANLLASTLMEVSRRPEIMYRLRTEVDAVLGSKLDVAYEDVLKLEYTMAVLKEALRIHSPAIATVREAAFDVIIDGYKIPKGSVMMVQMYVMSRMEEYFQNPLEFDPDRFLSGDDNIGQGFFPFSSGPRNCIGQHFALIEARVVLAKLIKNFHFELVPEQSFNMELTVTVKPKDGCLMYLKPL